MNDDSPFLRQQLQVLRKRRRWLPLSLVSVAAYVFSLHMVGAPPGRAIWKALTWVFFAGILLPRIVLRLDPCPRCRGSFFSAGPWWGRFYNPFASHCGACGLQLPARD